MAKGSPQELLAQELARAARDIAGTDGDVAAQVLTYSLLVRRWEPDLFREQVPETPEDSRVERVLDAADLEGVRQYYAAMGMDPSIYFYEEFLRAYDPGASKKRGVHYSPPEVVSFMVRAVESILRTEFGERLADAVLVDPCCGTGTFLGYVERNVSPQPRTIGLELSQTACELARVLLPNSDVVCGDWLGNFHVDTEGRTLVVIGNPPYSGHSANPGKIGTLMADYRRGLTERNPKWLQDDYVKFFRMAQHQVRMAGRGIVAFITNHGYLFNPTFRAMRCSLMEDFDLVYVVDLQGNARRNDSIPGPDQSVFPIQMGVGISLMVRQQAATSCSVSHVQVRGSRPEKLAWLAGAEFADLPWTDVPCAEPFCMFVPQDPALRDEYMGFPSILDFFDERSVGFVTSRDAFAVDVDKDALLARIAALRDPGVTPAELKAAYPIGDLDVERARQVLLADRKWEERAVSVLYRPFDLRWAYYSIEMMERPRLPFMRHMMAENVAIVVGRAGQATGSAVWDVVFCADRPVDLNLFRRGGATILPRYVYSNGTRRSNTINDPFDPDLFFGYIYAVLHSIEYRTRYADFLRFDVPRVPIHPDKRAVQTLAAIGRELMDLHLMKRDPAISDGVESLTIGGYDLPGKFIVDRRKTGLSEADKEHIEWIRRAAEETMVMQGRLGEVLKSSPPWPV